MGIQDVIRFFLPKEDHFYDFLEQPAAVAHRAALLARDYTDGKADLADASATLRDLEHEGDKLEHEMEEALGLTFVTPIDREDNYRANTMLDEIVNYCKDTVNEMDALGVTPDDYTREMAGLLHQGAVSLVNGFGKLDKNPVDAAVDADLARKANRKVEKLYRKALAALFQGDDYVHMFKRREIYRHLDNAAERVAHCANTLHDIVVKMV